MDKNLTIEVKGQNIIRPLALGKAEEFGSWVDKDSPLWQREYFVHIRRYQASECNDGFYMDDSDSSWENLVVYPFVEHVRDDSGSYVKALVGAAGFIQDSAGESQLEYCWIHPFFRNKGLLRSAWYEFKYKFGDFIVSQPRTKAMDAFLENVGYKDPL